MKEEKEEPSMQQTEQELNRLEQEELTQKGEQENMLQGFLYLMEMKTVRFKETLNCHKEILLIGMEITSMYLKGI
jgi:hypothetical protein